MLYLFTILGWISLLAFVPMVIYATYWQIAICLIMYFVYQMIGGNIGYHRIASHRMFKYSRWLEIVTVTIGGLMLKFPAIYWVAQHNAHHAKADTLADPHSIEKNGFFKAIFMIPLCTNSIHPKYNIHLLRDKFYTFQRDYYWYIIAAYAAILYLIDPFSLIYAWLAPCGLVHVAMTMAATYSHRGGKPHDDPIFALYSFGEGWHQFHHENPKAYKFHPTLDITGNIIDMIRVKK